MQKTIKTTKSQKNANISDTPFDQKTQVHWEAGFLRWHRQADTHATDVHCNLESVLA